jgi:glycosyltransferase involved in cell wall biosynthesis
LINRKQFDVIVFESIFSAAHIDQIKSECNAHLIYRAHNVEHKIWNDLAQGENNPVKKWYLKHLSQRLKSFELNFLNKVDSIFSISQIDQTFFKKYSNHSHYVPVSMIHEQGLPKIKKSISFLGAFNWAPNKEGVLWFVEEVFCKLNKQFPFVYFEIAGSFSEEISVLAKTKNIRLHGFVDSSKEFMTTHGIFVAPLLSGSGVKMKVIEAMSMGVPCVLSTHAAEGLDLPPIIPVCRTKDDFIEKLSLLLNDEQHCIDIGNAGRTFIQNNFSTELVSKKISAVLKL